MPRKKPEELSATTAPAAALTAPEPVAEAEPQTTKADAEVVVPAFSSGATKKVKLDLEVDTSVKDLGPNPYARMIHLAKAIDSWRIFPRIFITTYIYLLYAVVVWYMDLTDPTMEQSGLVSIVVGAGAAWFGLYLGSGKTK